MNKLTPSQDRKQTLLQKLRNLGPGGSEYDDPEANHSRADSALLEYINDPEVTEAFSAIEKWYS